MSKILYKKRQGQRSYHSRDYALQTNQDGSPLKPWISLSGDDDGKHYILYPQSEDKDEWTYDLELIIDTGNNSLDFEFRATFLDISNPKIT